MDKTFFPKIYVMYDVTIEKTPMVGEYHNFTGRNKRISKETFAHFRDARDYAVNMVAIHLRDLGLTNDDMSHFESNGRCGVTFTDKRDNETHYLYSVTIEVNTKDKSKK